jgi:hypothetical protein
MLLHNEGLSKISCLKTYFLFSNYCTVRSCSGIMAYIKRQEQIE